MTSVAPRHPLTRAESIALGIVLVAMVGFGIYGFATGAPSTVGYVLSVAVIVVLIGKFRSAPIPGLLAIALAVDAVAALAGGLITVGNDALYNASIGSRVATLHTHPMQYDHFAHAFGTFVATLTLWTLLAPPPAGPSGRRNLIVLCLLAGVGVGGLNETIEFIATLAHTVGLMSVDTQTPDGIS